MAALLLQAVRTSLLGLRNVRLHKLRSGLTVLGIVFGVCSVISMLAIGEGASREVLDQIRALGSQNVIIRSLKPPQDPMASSSQAQRGPGPPTAIDYGLRYADAERLAEVLPSVEIVVPIKAIDATLRHGANDAQAKVLGTVPWYPRSANLNVKRGRFISPLDMHRFANVCVLSESIARKLFYYREPLDQSIRIGTHAYRVIGVVEDPRGSTAGEAQNLPSELADVLVPLTTLRGYSGDLFFQVQTGGGRSEYVELHQLILKVATASDVLPTARIVESVLKAHHRAPDYEVIVPLRLLEQARRTQAIFSIVLGSIAAISLLVGGIGIMNIMLASVSERTREIGIRRALGARRRDILLQFLIECLILSVGGGLIGMGLGAAIPWFVTRFSHMPTVLTPTAFALAFAVSAIVGLVFGLYPARRAALMDPIEALRHE